MNTYFNQRSSYDKSGLGYIIGQKLAKHTEVRKEHNPVIETFEPKEND